MKTVLKTDGQHAEWFWAREYGDGCLMRYKPLRSDKLLDVSYFKSGVYLLKGVRGSQLLFTEKFSKN